jgi:hypothetical protein
VRDTDKRKQQLISELAELRLRIGELEAREIERSREEDALRRAAEEQATILNTMSEHVVYRGTRDFGFYGQTGRQPNR